MSRISCEGVCGPYGGRSPSLTAVRIAAGFFVAGCGSNCKYSEYTFDSCPQFLHTYLTVVYVPLGKTFTSSSSLRKKRYPSHHRFTHQSSMFGSLNPMLPPAYQLANGTETRRSVFGGMLGR